MEFFEAVKKRYSHRNAFRPDPIPEADLRKILDAGIRAPSGYNAQSCCFVVVTDAELRKKIAAIEPTPATETAPVIIVPVSERKDTHENLTFEIEDYAASVENIMLAITASGYASVWMDGMMKLNGVGEAIGRLLRVPAGKTVRALLPVGIPVEEGKQLEKEPFEKRVFFNSFD